MNVKEQGAPSKLENIDIDINEGTGDIFSFLDIAIATGAIISTVATLSIKALTIADVTASKTFIHLTLGDIFIIKSDILLGILLSINKLTVPIVPRIINSTLKSILGIISLTGNKPNIINKKALTKLTICLWSEKTKINI